MNHPTQNGPATLQLDVSHLPTEVGHAYAQECMRKYALLEKWLPLGILQGQAAEELLQTQRVINLSPWLTFEPAVYLRLQAEAMRSMQQHQISTECNSCLALPAENVKME